MGPAADGPSLLLVLDSAPILEGMNLEASRCVTVPEVAAEIRRGGATGRRFESLLAAGLRLQSASSAALARVRAAAEAAGSWGRLSGADAAVLALALDVGSSGRLLSDDYTVLDVAARLGLEASPVTKPGIDSGREWGARCVGCHRAFPAHLAGGACPVCGSEVKLRVRR